MAEGVGEVIEVKAGGIIVALVDPHTRMAHIGIEAIAIGFHLRVQHHLIELVRRRDVRLSGFENALFENKAAVNIYNRLRGFHEAHFKDGKAGLCVRLRKHYMA